MVFLLVRLYQGTGDAPALSCLCHRQEGLSGCRQRMGIENAGREVGGGVEGKGQAKSCTTVWTPLPPLAAQSGAPDSCRAGTKLPLRHPPQQLPRQLEHQFPAKTAVPPHRRSCKLPSSTRQNNSWPTVTISRVLIAQLALPHLSSDKTSRPGETYIR